MKRKLRAWEWVVLLVTGLVWFAGLALFMVLRGVEKLLVKLVGRT